MSSFVCRYYVEGNMYPLYEQTTEIGQTMLALVRRYGGKLVRVETVPTDRAKLEFAFDPTTGKELIDRDRIHTCK